MSLTDLWRSMREKLAAEKHAPASELLPRMRESARLRSLPPPSIGEVTPFATEIVAPPPGPPPQQPWEVVFPAHHKALVADLAKRGEAMTNWEIQDGQDQGVSEAGHTVSFTLHKTGTSATIRVELTLYKGHLAHVRVH